MTEYNSILAGILTVCGFGRFLDAILRDEIKTSISCRLRRATFDNRDVSNLFRITFDHVFDTRKYGRPRIIRSFLASYLFFVFLAIGWAIIYRDRVSIIDGWENLTAILVFIFVVNPIGDFFSLWQTRIVVGYLAESQKERYILPLLVADIVFTILVFVIAATLWRRLLGIFIYLLGYQTGGMFYLKELYRRYTFTCTGTGMVFTDATTYNDIVFLILFTTMLTSIWLWVFVIGTLLWSTFASIHQWVTIGWIHRFLNVEKYPVSIAMALGSLVIAPILFFAGKVLVSIVSDAP